MENLIDAAKDSGFEVISTYTDAQAVEDGVLVDITAVGVGFQGKPINRMTRTLWEDFQPFLAPYVVQGMTEIEAIGKVLRTKIAYAKGDPGNTGKIGDIVTIPPRLWLVRNEVGGWTAMYPEDY